ncbi:MAG TPA: ABC transporter ATP-binding protein, partial [Micromonospora sp.]
RMTTAPATRARPGAGAPASVGLRLDGVTFRYGRYAAPVVDRLSLTVPPDGHLAVVGPSGIGKSTLSRLVSGELRPESGTVSLGGTPVSQLDPALRHRLVAVIPQEAYVFAGTLRENLRYLAGPGPDSELDAAAAATGLAPVVARVGGYDAVLGPDGEDLPAGARQLVALTRVHLSAARLVILDEATCHLDPATEAQVERAFAARPGLLVVIAHRLGSARRARQVLVLGEAEPVVGTPAEVLAASPLYAELADH